MTDLLAWIVSGILFILSAVHLYWLLGGKGGIEAVLPTTGSSPQFRPSMFATGAVMLLLALSGWFVLELGGVISALFSDLFITYGGWLLSSVFILRAIGDFKWLGFFKKYKETRFAKWDSLLYSPLCLFIGAAILTIIYNE